MSIDHAEHYGQGMYIKRQPGRPKAGANKTPWHKRKSKFSLEQRLDAIENGDVEKLLAIAAEYERHDNEVMAAVCLKMAEAFSGDRIDAMYTPRTDARTKANADNE